MLKILITAATQKELNYIPKNTPSGVSITFLCTGIGIAQTSYILTKEIVKKKYDLVINTGICGSFNRNIEIGSVVCIHTDEFADIGSDTQNGYKTMFELGFGNANEFPFVAGKLQPKTDFLIYNLPKVSGITVSSATFSEKLATQRKKKYNAVAESMEGAAFFFVCMSEKVPCMQIRAISNYTGSRKNGSWDINKALANLKTSFTAIFCSIMELSTKI